jgi:hypothetical protein
MAKARHLFSAGLLVVGLTGLVMPSQWGYAAELGDNRISATPEMMQLLRDEHDLVAEMIRGQLAAERDRYKEQRTAVNTVSNPRQGDRPPSAMRGRHSS